MVVDFGFGRSRESGVSRKRKCWVTGFRASFHYVVTDISGSADNQNLAFRRHLPRFRSKILSFFFKKKKKRILNTSRRWPDTVGDKRLGGVRASLLNSISLFLPFRASDSFLLIGSGLVGLWAGTEWRKHRVGVLFWFVFRSGSFYIRLLSRRIFSSKILR